MCGIMVLSLFFHSTAMLYINNQPSMPLLIMLIHRANPSVILIVAFLRLQWEEFGRVAWISTRELPRLGAKA